MIRNLYTDLGHHMGKFQKHKKISQEGEPRGQSFPEGLNVRNKKYLIFLWNILFFTYKCIRHELDLRIYSCQ